MHKHEIRDDEWYGSRVYVGTFLEEVDHQRLRHTCIDQHKTQCEFIRDAISDKIDQVQAKPDPPSP